MSSPYRSSERTKHKLEAVIERDGNRCLWCSLELSIDDRRATLDHIVPTCRAGADHLDNLVLACQRCNCARGWFPAAWFLDHWLAEGYAVQLELLKRAWMRMLCSQAFRVGVGAVIECCYAAREPGFAELMELLDEGLPSEWTLQWTPQDLIDRYLALEQELEEQLAAMRQTVAALAEKLEGKELSLALLDRFGKDLSAVAFMLLGGKDQLARERIYRPRLRADFTTEVLDRVRAAQLTAR